METRFLKSGVYFAEILKDIQCKNRFLKMSQKFCEDFLEISEKIRQRGKRNGFTWNLHFKKINLVTKTCFVKLR